MPEYVGGRELQSVWNGGLFPGPTFQPDAAKGWAEGEGAKARVEKSEYVIQEDRCIVFCSPFFNNLRSRFQIRGFCFRNKGLGEV